MKKILTWLTVLCMLLSFAALAEDLNVIDPFADDEGVEVTEDEATDEEAPALAIPDNYPAGQELYLYDSGGDPNVGMITVGEMNREVLEARDAEEAENTVHITAKPGKQLFAFRLYFHNLNGDTLIDECFDAKVQVGEDLYICRKYIESSVPGSYLHENVRGYDVSMNERTYAYLVNVDDVSARLRSGYTFDVNQYYMFDVYTLVPDEALADGEAVFLILNVGEKQFWYQAQ